MPHVRPRHPPYPATQVSRAPRLNAHALCLTRGLSRPSHVIVFRRMQWLAHRVVNKHRY